jgi:hypothetical protein
MVSITQPFFKIIGLSSRDGLCEPSNQYNWNYTMEPKLCGKVYLETAVKAIEQTITVVSYQVTWNNADIENELISAPETMLI